MIRRIGLVSQSPSVSQSDLVKVAAAINVQVARDLRPIWNVDATVSALTDRDAIPPGVCPVFIQDDINARGEAGIHLTQHNQPYALVEAGSTWSLTASHEVLELLVDPSGNRLVTSSGLRIENNQVVDDPDTKVEYLLEVADPSEDARFAYVIDDVLVSDFYTPNFFDHVAAAGVRYSFSGRITGPRQVLDGGYISWLDVSANRMRQLKYFGNPQIVTIPGKPQASLRRTLRGFVDEATPPTIPLSASSQISSDVAGAKLLERTRWMQQSATRRAMLFSAARAPAPPAQKTQQEVLDIVNANKATFKGAGATRAYAGWHFENHWITNDRAIVVLARRPDLDHVRSAVPATLEGLPVEVRVDPRPPKKTTPSADMAGVAAMATGTVREELASPVMPGEVNFDEDVDDTPNIGLAAMAAHRQLLVENYQAPQDGNLQAQTLDMSLCLHISPESGWSQLKPFLSTVASELVVGMYEFTAKHIESSLLAGLGDQSQPKLTLTMDSPSDPKTRDQTVEDTEDQLKTALKNRQDFSWALSGLGKMSPAKMFSTAYHIKVAVKDQRSVWLSSGNWNTSNQPDVDPNNEVDLRKAAQTSDRDWHVIIEDCPAIAKVYKAYLEQDYLSAKAAAAAHPRDAVINPGRAPTDSKRATATGPEPKQFFKPLTLKGKIRVQPLLTPDIDGYRKPIIDLIKNAKSRIYMQTQYIHPSDGRDKLDKQSQTHADLLAALTARVADGLDVKLITSEYQDFTWIEKTQDSGLDPVSHLRIQDRVHNKGIVIDSEIAVVSSQNWSAEGTGSNRDAGIIIFDPRAAAYLEEIFLHDWLNLASARTTSV